MRIGIVNDLAIVAEGLRRVVASIPESSTAWIACNGAEALEKCKIDTPDLVLMDLIMPVMDGVEATRRIMSESPCAILVVTATVDGNSAKVFEALGAGALDAVQTPALGVTGGVQSANALKFKIETLRQRSHADGLGGAAVVGMGSKLPSAGREPLIAIGASAGGPAAIAAILSRLPSDYFAPIVIVQHIDAQFVPSMVHWLNQHSKIQVRMLQGGERPEPGIVYIAATNDHLVFLDSATLGYTDEPREYCYRPSVDVFFESVARHWRGKVAAVLLSGMGRDGAQGLKRLRDRGAITIAQDSATSAVYGMPKAAVELNAAQRILPVSQIAGELVDFLSSRK